jgi:leucyl aminopeptidase
LSPKGFVEIIKKEIKNKKLEKFIGVEVWDEKKMKKENMHAVLAVGGGAHHGAQFLILKYQAGKKHEKPIVLVGKGVTFDTGGSNLKPGNAMCGMHMDMMGGAAVASTIIGAAMLGIKKNIITLVPLVENRLSHRSYLPGDIIIGRSGKAIEIMNTDAEGRVILSDALTYATEQNPELIIDVATLTGAALTALGVRASAMFSNDDTLAKGLYNIGLETKNKVWQLPVWDEYLSDIQGKYGGLTNTHKNSLGHGGSIMGAIFFEAIYR